MAFEKLSNDALVLYWNTARAALEAAKSDEMEARKEIVARYFAKPSEGTNRFALGQGYELKYVHKFNFNVSNKDGICDAALETLRKSGNEGAFIADRLIRWKPDLSISEYRKLSPEHRKIIDPVVTVTPAAPELELCEPKAKKA